MPRFVLEIGTEEIPPRYFPVALPSLAEQGKTMLERARLSYGEVKVYGTPRRLVLIAEDMAGMQAPVVREERGPAVKVAFDSEGRPTKAAEGFARRWGLTPENLERRRTEQGEYVFAVMQEPELPAAQALAALLPGLITSISFPKTMRWGAGSLRFGRPIRWLLALVDDQVVEFELDGIKSGRLTRGHPVLAEGMFAVGHAQDYENALASWFVLVDPAERQKRVQDQLDTITQMGKTRVVDVRHGWPRDPGDLSMFRDEISAQMEASLSLQTMFLVEWPTVAKCGFDASFLSLPRPVLEEEMRHVQGYFPLADHLQQLVPSFLAVRDGGEKGLSTVVTGWEGVLRAKLIDARYFYEQDRKRPLSERVDALRGVVFHEKLGSMLEKTERVRAISADLADQVGLTGDEKASLDRAAYLCKADLTTEMVQELPGLQGIMGGEYARLSGEAPDAWVALRDQYRPRFAGDECPDTRMGALLAVADKLDTICACFAIGVVPTGSADPYALRRDAIGVVRILVEQAIKISTSRAISAALKALSGQIPLPAGGQEVARQILDFMKERLDAYLRADLSPVGGVRYDLVAAALAVGCDDLRSAADRAFALQRLAVLSPHPDFLPTVIACTRPINISKDFEGGEVDPGLFEEEAERALWEAYQEALKKADSASLVELFGVFAGMREVIDRFFDEVLVMHTDEKIRRNRLALCWHINHDLFRRLADFSLIVQT